MLGLNPADFGPNADLSPEKVAKVRGQMFDRLQRSEVGAVREEIADREEVTVYDGGDDESDGGRVLRVTGNGRGDYRCGRLLQRIV